MKKPNHFIGYTSVSLHTTIEGSSERLMHFSASCLLIPDWGWGSGGVWVDFLNPVFLEPGRCSDELLCCLNARWHTLTFVLFLKNMQCYFHKCNHTTNRRRLPGVQVAGVSSLPVSRRDVSTHTHILVPFTLNHEESL